MPQLEIVKVGGALLDECEQRRAFAQVLKGHPRRRVIVHGGGPQVTDLQRRLGLKEQIVGGLRATGPEDLKAVVMVLSGWMNKSLVATLLEAGINAVGISGFDGGTLIARRKDEQLGLVGTPAAVNPDLINSLLEGGFVPVIAPVGLEQGSDQLLNINADEVSAALAKALNVETLTFLTDSSALRDADNRPIETITRAEVLKLIDQGVIYGGMLPKVRGALAALEAGAGSVRIAGVATYAGGGTRIFAV